MTERKYKNVNINGYIYELDDDTPTIDEYYQGLTAFMKQVKSDFLKHRAYVDKEFLPIIESDETPSLDKLARTVNELIRAMEVYSDFIDYLGSWVTAGVLSYIATYDEIPDGVVKKVEDKFENRSEQE